jgi:hypothetical protein
MYEREEVYVPKALLISMGGFTAPDLSKFITDYGITCDERGVALYAVIAALNKARKKRRFGEQDDDLERELKLEKLQSERIRNQERLGILIEKDYAKERVRRAFVEVATRMRYQIKQTAVKVAPMTSARDCEMILTNDYNDVIDDLEAKAINMRWEDDGLQVKFGRTELASDSKADSGDGSSSEVTSSRTE